jgi:hypothetical protein
MGWKMSVSLFVRKPFGGLLILLLLFASLVTACSEAATTYTPVTWHEVDPLFREFYNYLGGEAILGPVISSVIQQGDITVQFTENAMLVFDPNARAQQRFRLAPIGAEMGFKEPPVPQPSQPGSLYVNGHIVAPYFVNFYQKLGASTVGSPLTEVRPNPNRKREEQYFENLGLYYSRDTGQVGLLAYGAMACDSTCRKQGVQISNDNQGFIDVLPLAEIHPVFQGVVTRLGTDFTGFPLTEAYVGEDGLLQQIFENVVLFARSPNNPNSVGVRPLAEELSVPSDKPKPASGNPNMYFYELKTGSGRGYEIPSFFWEYIVQHGGTAPFGQPITHLNQQGELAGFQCFTNLCLRYDLFPGMTRRIRPETLGYPYMTLYYRPGAQQITPQVTPDLIITLRSWERYPLISSAQNQEIGVGMFLNDLPLRNIIPILTLRLPNGGKQVFNMPPTGVDGTSVQILPPVSAPNSTLITYTVCLLRPSREMFCVEDSFIIWNNP